jgi:hypothetical protein
MSVCTNVIGQTSFSYFSLFSFSSVHWSNGNINVKMSVCTNVTDGQTSFSFRRTNTDRNTVRSVYTLNVTDGTIQEQTCHYNITFSQYAMQCNAMQYSVIQCNAMQCNTANTMQYNTAMQCNVTRSPSVRTEWMKSVSHFFFFFFHFLKYKIKNLVKQVSNSGPLAKNGNLNMYGRTDVRNEEFYLS